MSDKIHLVLRAVQKRKKYTDKVMCKHFTVERTSYRYWLDGNRKFLPDEMVKIMKTVQELDPELIRMMIARTRDKWYFSEGWRWAWIPLVILINFNLLGKTSPEDKTFCDKFLAIYWPPYHIWLMTVLPLSVLLYHLTPLRLKKIKKDSKPTPEVEAVLKSMDDEIRVERPELSQGVINFTFLAICLLGAVASTLIFNPAYDMGDTIMTKEVVDQVKFQAQIYVLLAAWMGLALATRSASMLRSSWTVFTVLMVLDFLIGFWGEWDSLILTLVAILGIYFHIYRRLDDMDALKTISYKMLGVPKL